MFRDIVGDTRLVQRLRMLVDEPDHAYVLVGGEGKFDLAQAFAKALQCEDPCEGEACGTCLSCRVFDSRNHPDMFYVKATKTKAIGVDDVRAQIVMPMSEKPFRYRYKIFIVPEPPTAQAQNALLKTIEEPAPFGIFLLLTESLELLLPTVLSRCTILKLSTPHQDAVKQQTKDDDIIRFAQMVAENINSMDIIALYALYPQFDKWRDTKLLDMLYLNCRKLHDIRSCEAISKAMKALSQNGNFQMTIENMLLKMQGRY